MSETPKKKAATKKAVNEHASAYNNKPTKAATAPKKAVPAKKAAVKKTTTKKAVETPDEVLAPVVSSLDSKTFEALLTKAPGFWARVKQFFLGA